jgi:hypothetical protein
MEGLILLDSHGFSVAWEAAEPMRNMGRFVTIGYSRTTEKGLLNPCQGGERSGHEVLWLVD